MNAEDFASAQGGGWVSHCIEYYTYNMRKRKQNHRTRVYCNPDAIKSRNVVR